jgi:hypothetical protein
VPLQLARKMQLFGAWFFVPRSRITQENFDRIQEGMTEDEVAAIFGEQGKFIEILGSRDEGFVFEREWDDGLNRIVVDFEHGKMRYKGIELATAWETVTWYAKRGAAKIGVHWD